jgi:predicted lipoprotein with Yx(FWY)xxD motif
MWSFRRMCDSVLTSRKSRYVAVAVVAVLGFGSIVFASAHRTVQPRPAALPIPIATGGDEGPAEPQRPTVIVVHPGSRKPAIMADQHGFTLYAFSADQPRRSQCTKECARRWRPVVSSGGKPQAGAGVNLPSIGSMLRDDGSFQVTFNDVPLYYFVDDKKPGDENGDERDEFGGHWQDDPPVNKRPGS